MQPLCLMLVFIVLLLLAALLTLPHLITLVPDFPTTLATAILILILKLVLLRVTQAMTLLTASRILFRKCLNSPKIQNY